MSALPMVLLFGVVILLAGAAVISLFSGNVLLAAVFGVLAGAGYALGQHWGQSR